MKNFTQLFSNTADNELEDPHFMASVLHAFLPLPLALTPLDSIAGMETARSFAAGLPGSTALAHPNPLSPSANRYEALPSGSIFDLWRQRQKPPHLMNTITKHPERCATAPCNRGGGKNRAARRPPQADAAYVFAQGGCMVFHGRGSNPPLWMMAESGSAAREHFRIRIAKYINESIGKLEKLLGRQDLFHKGVDAIGKSLLGLRAEDIGFELYENIVYWYDDLGKFAQDFKKGSYDGLPRSVSLQFHYLRAASAAATSGSEVFHGHSGSGAIQIATHISESLGRLEKNLGDMKSFCMEVEDMADHLQSHDIGKIGFEAFKKAVLWHPELVKFAQDFKKGIYDGQPQRARLLFNRLRNAVPQIASAVVRVDPHDSGLVAKANFVREDKPPPIRDDLPYVEGVDMEFVYEPAPPPDEGIEIDIGDDEDAEVEKRAAPAMPAKQSPRHGTALSGAGVEAARREMARTNTPPPNTEPPRDYVVLDLTKEKEINAGSVWNEIQGKLENMAKGQALVVTINHPEDRFRAFAERLGKLIDNFGFDEITGYRVFLYCHSLPGLYYSYSANLKTGNFDIDTGVDMTWHANIKAEKDWKAILTGIDAIQQGNALYVQLPGMISGAFNSIAIQIKSLLQKRVLGLNGKFVVVQCQALGIEAVYLVTNEGNRLEVNYVSRDIGQV